MYIHISICSIKTLITFDNDCTLLNVGSCTQKRLSKLPSVIVNEDREDRLKVYRRVSFTYSAFTCNITFVYRLI